ncbi:hypothetical protein GGR52DRAFT_21611 [Hypoxylon sp. FL1284]|nr:hypothetical protein GGR52DRAFT_21611 [Hypoxylon sp. FL1284]
MDSQRSFSGTETRLLDQVCGAISAKTDEQRSIVKNLIDHDLASEWTQLVASMESNGPLSMLSDDEMKYMNALDDDQLRVFSQTTPASGQKMADHNMTQAAVHDLHQYNDILEKILARYKDYAGRSISTMQQATSLNAKSSIIEEKMKALSLKKDSLRKEIRALERKVDNHTTLPEGITQSDEAAEADAELHDENRRTNAKKDIFEYTFSSYDHILEKLNALRGELGNDIVEDDAVLGTARRHASQVVLSQATRCRASLDIVFIEASHRSSKHEQHTSSRAQAIDEERSAVYSEIQSLWDEMVPLAHMVVEKEYLKPISDKIEKCSGRQKARDATVAIYTTTMLRFMNERLCVLLDRISSLVCHLRILSNALMHMSASRPQSQTMGLTEATKAVSASDRGKKTNGQTLHKTIQRQMELYGPIPVDSEKEHLTLRKQVNKLDSFVMSRQKKGDDLSRNMHENFERTVRAELTNIELAGQLLLDSVMVDSAAGYHEDGNVYEDQQVEDSVASVKSQAAEIQEVIKELLGDESGSLSSAPDIITYAYNKASKRLSRGDLGDQERCAKLTALIRKWGDPAGVTD